VLDVFDGVRLGALIAPAAGTVRHSEAGTVTLDIGPLAETSVPIPAAGATSSAEFTLVINRAAVSAVTVDLGTLAGDTTAFGAPYLCIMGATCTATTNAGASTTLAAASGVSYLEVFLPAVPAAVAGNVVTLPVRVAPGLPTAPEVVLSARIRAATDFVTSASGNSILNGGGFNFVDGKTVTSRHNADPADNSLNPWGYSGNPSVPTSTNTGQNPVSLASPLQCTSCHNPHGTENYRILKEGVNGRTVNVKAYFSGAFTKQEGARGLEAGAPADKYIKEYYGSSGLGGDGDATSAGGGLATLCGACHTAYPSTGASAPFIGGSPNVTHYRHKTEMFYRDWSNPDTGRLSSNPEITPIAGFPNLRLASSTVRTDGIVTCLTCHRVHGTATVMNGYALKPSTATLTPAVDTGLADEDLTPSQGLDHTNRLSLSTLLFTDNRGMCEACHQWGFTTPSGPD
jgi:predicted CXXCH cytochrome family protein